MTPTKLDQALRAEEVLAKELGGYAGCWVAISDRSIVAFANSLEDLLSRVDPEGLDRIFEVAETPVAGCFY